VLIHRNLAACVGLDPGDRDIQLIAISLAAYGVEQALPMNVLSAFQFGEYPITFFVESNRYHLLAEAKYGP